MHRLASERSMQRVLMVFAGLGLISRIGHAAELELPASENPALWRDAIVVSGLARVPGKARLEAGTQWRLVVTRADGTRLIQELAPPTNAEARETAAILAASLLRPATTTALPLPPPPPPPSPPAASTPAPRPSPRPVPSTVPVSKPAPQPEPIPTAPAPSISTLEPSASTRSDPFFARGVALTMSATGRSTTDQRVGIGMTGAGSVYTSLGAVFELGLSQLWTPRTDLDRPDRSLVATNLWLGGGWVPPAGLPVPVGCIGGSQRRYRLDGETVANLTVPVAALGMYWDPLAVDTPAAGLRTGFRLERDFRSTVLASLDGSEGPIERWAMVVHIGGRLGPTFQPRDTAP
ncbi:MAG: hypothetical protein CL927_18780 [Deltaproteobacteria bacterium]|nr:hypothetical protein [Deltaproteobacteria bacterium]